MIDVQKIAKINCLIECHGAALREDLKTSQFGAPRGLKPAALEF